MEKWTESLDKYLEEGKLPLVGEIFSRKKEIGDKLKLQREESHKIAIARVFLKNPPILILDEATSALDNESEILVGQSLEKLAHGRTTLTIAHRLTTIKDYDRILVLGEEGIVEEGTHAQLLEKQGIYYRLWNQLPAEDGE